jgi:alkanesulfonate monooxygenase SsuD/methylene tetrahydromethanopterin reductase-like flavin-dependent oxidoreductase (luciferase family)
LTDFIPHDHPLRGIHASPIPERPPEVWLLGSSDQSGALVAHFGLAFSFAQFISPDGGSWVTNAYREAFKPSTALAEPKCSLGVFVICAESEDEEERHARRRELRPVPSLEEVESHEFTAE